MKQTIRTVMGIAAIIASGQAASSGFALIENSASGMGNSFAGGAASAEDASTLWFNPAGMTRFSGSQILAAGHIIMPTSKFTDDGSSTSAATGSQPLDGPDDDGGRNALVPNFYWLTSLSDDLKIGVGVNAPFGLGTQYQDDWIGRYHAVESDTATININPSIAYRFNPSFSGGFGINAQYIDVQLTSAIDLGSVCFAQELAGTFPSGYCDGINSGVQNSDGFADLTADNWAYGYNFGLMYEVTEQLRFGFAYRSAVTHDAEGDADFSVPSQVDFLTSTGNFVDTTLKASVDLPDQYSLSYFHQINKDIAVMVDWTRTNWSSFTDLTIEYDSVQPDSVTTENWVDSDRFSVGMNYLLEPTWLLRFGLAYDETPIPDDQHRTARIPGNDRTWLSAGVSHRVDKEFSFAFGYAHLFVEDTRIDNTFESTVPTLNHNLNGTYDASVDIFSAQLTWNY